MTETFQQAFEQLLQRAPSPLFPRARQLYLRKYCLEAAEAGALRTFLLEEEIREQQGGSELSVHARRFALVHWQAPALSRSAYLSYLHERWQLVPDELEIVSETPWFRDGGAWAWFRFDAVYLRRFDPVAPAV